jgi:KamA family protein
LPFKTNNYIVNELIDWDNYTEDPMFNLNFPRKEMLRSDHFEAMAGLLQAGADNREITRRANEIRLDLNPHPAGQLEHNVPTYQGEPLPGVQHKYRETALFFPSHGQTCHAYCTFCFRWPQFTGISSLKFAMKQTDRLVGYLREHPEISDVIFTGGDPMVMSAGNLAAYLEAILDAGLPGLKHIRIGTKTLGFWPYRYLTDPDADEVLDIFRRVVDRGIHLAFMAHINHPAELSTSAAQEAAGRILKTGVQIRTQSPVLNHINAKAEIWASMWKQQVSLGMIPYYMFVSRDTGAKEFFALPLSRTWQIFRKAYAQVSGICRTVRGPSMSANPGKLQIVGVAEIHGERVFVLNFLQARNPEWVGRPFFASYNEKAYWLNDLKPAFGKSEFFYSREFRRRLKINEDSMRIYAEELERVFRKCSGKWYGKINPQRLIG